MSDDLDIQPPLPPAPPKQTGWTYRDGPPEAKKLTPVSMEGAVEFGFRIGIGILISQVVAGALIFFFWYALRNA